MYNAVSVSGVQQSGLDIYIYMYVCIYTYIYIYIYVLFQILFSYRLLQNTEWSSLYYTVGSCCLPILYIVVCIC